MIFQSKIFKKFFGDFIDYTDYYTIQKDPTTGKWTIYDYDGFGVAGYSRRSDAFRGAERAGYTLI